MFSDTSLLASFEHQLEGRAVGRLETGSGRTYIWDMAIRGAMESPLFGQGMDFWSLENRLRWGLMGAVHAHNLFLQVFSVSGFVGLTALLVFLYFFVRYSIRAAKITHGGSIAMLAVFFHPLDGGSTAFAKFHPRKREPGDDRLFYLCYG